MNNREKLNSLSNTEFMNKIVEIANTEGFDFVAWEEWLEGTNEKPQYMGAPGTYRESVSDITGWEDFVKPGECVDSEPVECIILEPIYLSTTIRGYHILVNGKQLTANEPNVQYLNPCDKENEVWPEPPVLPERPAFDDFDDSFDY